MALLLLTSCTSKGKAPANEIKINRDLSYFSGFEVIDDKVHIKCYITLENSYRTEKTVRLSMNSPDDVALGLLKNSPIKALSDDGSEIDWLIDPTSTKSFNVIFVGEFAGKQEKTDRLLPEITIKVVK